MSARLETAAEVLKLSRLLGTDDLGFLGDVPATELRSLREAATDELFDAGGSSWGRVALGAKLTPSPLVATISQRAFGPLLCARAAGAVEPAKAIDVAKRLPADFLADVTVELDPRRVAEIIGRVPRDLVVPVAAELGRRGEHVTMGRFLAFVPDDAIVAAMSALSDEAMLRTAFVLEHKDRLDHAVGLLPPDRLPGVLTTASQLGLWSEALDLLQHLSDERRGPVADVIAAQDDDVVAALVASVAEADIWESLLPVVGTMSPESLHALAGRPAFHDDAVLLSIVHAAARTGLWHDLLPLISELPGDVVAQLPPVVAELDDAHLSAMVTDAVAAPDVVSLLLDLATSLDDLTVERIVSVIDAADRPTGEAMVAAVSGVVDVAALLDRAPEPIVTAIERAADRMGLRQQYDALLE